MIILERVYKRGTEAVRSRFYKIRRREQHAV